MRHLIFISLVLILNNNFAQEGTPTTNYDIPASNNQFAVELYKQLSSQNGNTFFSPFSISTAMAMTYAGARGITGDEMARVMHFGSDQKQFHGQYKAYLDKILEDKKEVKLNIANSLWAQKDYTFLETFLNLTEDNYGAPVHLVDYTTDTEREKTRKSINKWVEDKTNDKIKDLLQPSDLEPLTRLVLTNAIYFYGNWEKPFDPALTESGTFRLDKLSSVEAKMMKQKADFKYFEDEKVQYIEIPYVLNQLSMVIALPRDVESLAELEKELSLEKIDLWTNEALMQKVNIIIPKFHTSFRTSLNKSLSDMGVKEAFTDDADFSAMTGGKDLLISNVIHQAYVDVNEAGTEAAAATAVVMRMKSAFTAEEKFFTADHPFLFYIKDNKTGSILFIGRVLNPIK